MVYFLLRAQNCMECCFKNCHCRYPKDNTGLSTGLSFLPQAGGAQNVKILTVHQRMCYFILKNSHPEQIKLHSKR